MADCTCGHPKRSHKHASGNAHGKTVWYSSCRKTDCDCTEYEHDG